MDVGGGVVGSGVVVAVVAGIAGVAGVAEVAAPPALPLVEGTAGVAGVAGIVPEGGVVATVDGVVVACPAVPPSAGLCGVVFPLIESVVVAIFF